MRYFLEVAYKGTGYAGFQIQQNAQTIQGEVAQALKTVLNTTIELTGSSRTDAGVHGYQNYFHFDIDFVINPQIVYNLNAILPLSIVIKSIKLVESNAHSRFHAVSREYKYYITKVKNPFVTDTAWYYPYAVDIDILNDAAKLITEYTDFTSFAKRNTQVNSNQSSIIKSQWYYHDDLLVYNVEANRFLRGMVRGLVGTMLLAARKKITLQDFKEIIEAKDCTKASFATPAYGLFLASVKYPKELDC